MKKIIFSTILVAVAFIAIAAKTTFAECGGQYGQYGGCSSAQSIMIDKLVGKNSVTDCNTTPYVDNLSPTDPRFKANNLVCFQIKVKNPSSITLNNVKVVDTIPNYLSPVEGPGNYDAASKTITFYIPQLQANEEKISWMKMQVKNQTALNAIVEQPCENNAVSASADNVPSQSDTSQFCVEKQVAVGVTQVPSTGPEDILPILIGSISALGAGIVLKKKTNSTI